MEPRPDDEREHCYPVTTIAPMMRERLLAYAMATWNGYRPAAHHRLIASKLEAVERGEIRRLMIFLPPRHGKSALASEYFPAWYIGRNAEKQIIHCTYAQDFADDLGMKVRNQIADPMYQEIFPGVDLESGSRAASKFGTSNGGIYRAVGAGGPITGRGAHLLLIDDPIRGREDADSETMRRKLKDWYGSVAYTRLMPDSAVVIIQCMTGDTPVLMADGSYRDLRFIRKGDKVATYDNGVLSTAVVKNWINNGFDSVHRIKMSSGVIVKANERHPFLVNKNGIPEWIRLKNLRQGQEIYRVNGENGKARHASGRAATSLLSAVATAPVTTAKNDGLMGSGRHLLKQIRHLASVQNLKIATASLLPTIKRYSKSKVVDAQYVSDHQKMLEIQRIGMKCFASITATTQTRCEAFSVMIAIWQSGAERLQKYLKQRRTTSDFTLDRIESIEYAGEEEVFDVQISGTENFIANGLVSHNTRWHSDDLSGWLLREHRHENWEVLSLPAIDEAGRALWPEAYPLERLLTIRKALGERDWAALYQQQPTVDGGNILKRKWWRWWPDDKQLPKCDHVFLSWDTAYSDADMKGNAHSACTVWGVFWHEQEGRNCLLLLKTWHGMVDYPDLRKKAKELDRELEPDCHLIEKKASGQSLLQDLRRIPGVLVRVYNPDRDKVTRAYSVQAMLESGQVFAPNRRWAEALVDWVAQFPNGTPPSADFTDTVTQALLYLRNGWWLEHPDDKLTPPPEAVGADDEDGGRPRRRQLYG